MRQRLFALIAAALLAGGCVEFEPYQEITKYDLFCDRVDGKASSHLYVTEFKDLTGSDGRMQIRHPDGRISAAQDTRWALPPGSLVPRALNESLPEAALNAPEMRISGTLLRFEANLSNRTFVLSGNWRRTGTGVSVPFNIAVPLADTRPVSMTAAATNAVMRLAESIAAATEAK